MGDRDKDVEILVLRHQITVLERQLGADARVRFAPEDRALLAALLTSLPCEVLRRVRLLVRPDTVLRRHRDLMRRRHARICRPKRRGRPPTVRSIRALILRLIRENPGWGYRRVHGELATLGIKVAPSTVWEILKQAGLDPAPERASTTWADFLRSQADAILACDFIEAVTLSGQRQYVLVVIEHATRRVRVLGTTAHPSVNWVIQAIRNLVMDLDDVSCRARFLLRDRDGKFPALMDEVLAEARHNEGAHRHSDAAYELHHGAVGAVMPPRAPRPLPCMERTPPTPRPARIRTLLQPAPSPPSPEPSSSTASRPGPDHRSRTNHRPERTPTRPARRHPPRVLTCRLNCTDGIIGRRRPGKGPWPRPCASVASVFQPRSGQT